MASDVTLLPCVMLVAKRTCLGSGGGRVFFFLSPLPTPPGVPAALALWFTYKLSLPSQFDMLEMDRLERMLVNLPLLKDPSTYVPDTVDLTDDALARKYWLTCFEEALDGVRVFRNLCLDSISQPYLRTAFNAKRFTG